MIGFRAVTCEGCEQIYNAYNHQVALEHIICLNRLTEARFVNWQIDNPDEWRRLCEKFRSIRDTNR